MMAETPPNKRMHPTGFASLRSARLRVMRVPLGSKVPNGEDDSMESRAKTEPSTYFHDAAVESGGRTYYFNVSDGRALESAGNYWHGPGAPSTWLAVAVFLEARQRVGEAGDDVALELAAKVLLSFEPSLSQKIVSQSLENKGFEGCKPATFFGQTSVTMYWT